MTRILSAGFLCWLALILSACGGGGGGSSPPKPPVVVLTADVTSGVAPLTVQFDASKSSSPQGSSLTFAWDFGDGSTPGSGASVSHVFANHGAYTATVTASDGSLKAATPVTVTVTPAPPTIASTSISVNVLGVAATTGSVQVSATDRESLALTYSISAAPKIGTATINSSTGAINYTVPGYAPGAPNPFTVGATDPFTVTVANLGASSASTVNVALNSDPLLPNQWHIQNIGQAAFSSAPPLSGIDMNVAGAWTAGYSGKGIKVAVVDSGVQAAHEDLQANFDLPHSFNFLTGGSDPTSMVSVVSVDHEDHGTQVAGIIGAVAFNGKGGRGIAYNATLRGYNLLAPNAGTVGNEGVALGGATISSDNDIFNGSFGSTTVSFQGPVLPQFDPAQGTILANLLTLRNGLGAAFVQSAGNEFQTWTDRAYIAACFYANQNGVSCGDPAADTRRASTIPIIVGALNGYGTKANYSSTGSSLWISAPGGGYGWDTSLTTGLTPFPEVAGFVNQPAIITTAYSGCSNYSTVFNALDDLGANPLASTCQYTARMNGTSSAAPMVAGVVALMLEANPKLSTSDIKYILAKTAKKVDPNMAPIKVGAGFVLEQGWVTNAAGFAFNNWYGFGGIDASAAVSMAKTYTTYLATRQQSPAGTNTFVLSAPATIPGSSYSTVNFAVNEAFTTVEGALVYFSVESAVSFECVQVELVSPSGTKSIIMHAANGFNNSSVYNTRLESNAFYGEAPNGTWVLTALNFCSSPIVLPAGWPLTLLLVGH